MAAQVYAQVYVVERVRATFWQKVGAMKCYSSWGPRKSSRLNTSFFRWSSYDQERLSNMGDGDGELGLEGISPDSHTWAVSIQVRADAKPTFGSLGSPYILPVKTETNSWGLKMKKNKRGCQAWWKSGPLFTPWAIRWLNGSVQSACSHSSIYLFPEHWLDAS